MPFWLNSLLRIGNLLDGLSLETFNLLLHRVVFLDIFLDNALEVLGVVEERLDGLQHILHIVDQILAVATRGGLDTADTSGNAALRENLEETDATC